MMIHEITKDAGAYKARKRVGRGPGSGRGKRATRGQKGAGSRGGYSRRFQFEGGQMPYFRRMPKFGFSNANFATRFWVVNIDTIATHPEFKSGGDVTPETLIKAGLIRDLSREVKILGRVGDAGLKSKLKVDVHRVSASARMLIEGAGGSVNERGTRRDRVRGVDRNTGDMTPKNLTKKLKRYKALQKKREASASKG